MYDKKGNEINGYQGFSVIGTCGPVSYANSEIIEKRYVPNGPIVKNYKGAEIGLDKWDGTDFFTSEHSYKTVITKKVIEALKKNKITNLKLENITEIEIPVRFVTGKD